MYLWPCSGSVVPFSVDFVRPHEREASNNGTANGNSTNMSLPAENESLSTEVSQKYSLTSQLPRHDFRPAVLAVCASALVAFSLCLLVLAAPHLKGAPIPLVPLSSILARRQCNEGWIPVPLDDDTADDDLACDAGSTEDWEENVHAAQSCTDHQSTSDLASCGAR